jgi:hypothetical protein
MQSKEHLYYCMQKMDTVEEHFYYCVPDTWYTVATRAPVRILASTFRLI